MSNQATQVEFHITALTKSHKLQYVTYCENKNRIL